jgi:hypothetical protein
MTFKALAAAADFALATLASPAAHAEEDARMGLARELMALMRIESLLGDFFTTMSPMIADGMGRDLQLSPVETARLSEIVGEELRAATRASASRWRASTRGG